MMAVQTAILMGAGDVICQTCIEKESKGYDWMRTARFAGVGLFVVGPTLQAWYKTLDRYILYSGAKGALMKVGVDQLVFAPIFLVTFISTMGTLNGETMDKIKKKLEQDYFNVLTTNWKVWGIFQTFNFYFIPLQHRVMAAQTAALFWNVYLSYVTNNSQITGGE